LLSADASIIRNRERLVGLAAQHKIPAAYPIREFAALGGLLSYGPNYAEAYRQVADYLGRVLNGEKPENLPVQQVTKLELIINMKTATSLGLEIPAPLLARADEVFEGGGISSWGLRLRRRWALLSQIYAQTDARLPGMKRIAIVHPTETTHQKKRR
jgi:hypothetical protein